MRFFVTRRAWFAIGAALLLGIASCGGGDADVTSASNATREPAEAQDFSARGSFGVGVTQLDVDPPVLVFYPADNDAPPARAQVFGYSAEDVWGDLAGVLPDELRGSYVEVGRSWRDVPASRHGKFPMVVFSHGLATSRFSHSLHGAHVASWGYVVAFPAQTTRDTVAAIAAGDDRVRLAEVKLEVIDSTIAALVAENARVGSILEGRVAVDQIAVEGHSVGGAEAVLSAYRSDVDTAIGLATTAPVPTGVAGEHRIVQEGWYGFDPAAGEFDLDGYLSTTEPPTKPSLIVFTEHDLLFPVRDARAVFNWLRPTKRFAVLADTGHFLFVDGCAKMQQAGGSDDLAAALGMDPESQEMRSLENGCSPGDAPVAKVTALWNHLTVAHLNSVFDVNRDVATASLEYDYLDQRFPGGLAEYVAE